MKFSIVTPTFNSAATVRDCLESIARQKGVTFEHIIIDGGSTDETLAVIKSSALPPAVLVSETDSGIYDAMNKGLRRASGDVIGILNSDDLYAADDVLAAVGETLEKTGLDSCYGDLDYVDRADTTRIVRRWRNKPYRPELFRRGWMPPHPAFFVRKAVYDKHGLFNLDFPLAADYELMLRFLYFRRVSSVHLPRVLVKMRRGGKAHPGPANTAKMMAENRRSWIVNGERPGPLTIFLKRVSKIRQFFS